MLEASCAAEGSALAALVVALTRSVQTLQQSSQKYTCTLRLSGTSERPHSSHTRRSLLVDVLLGEETLCTEGVLAFVRRSTFDEDESVGEEMLCSDMVSAPIEEPLPNSSWSNTEIEKFCGKSDHSSMCVASDCGLPSDCDLLPSGVLAFAWV